MIATDQIKRYSVTYIKPLPDNTNYIAKYFRNKIAILF